MEQSAIPDASEKIPVFAGPKAGFSGGSVIKTGDDLAEVKAHTKYLYIWGEARYRDIFADTPEHVTRFAYQIEVLGNPTKPSSPDNIVQMNAITLPRHNCAARVLPTWIDRPPIFFSILNVFVSMPENREAFLGNKSPIELNKSGFSYVGRFLGGFESKPQKEGLYHYGYKLEKSNNYQKPVEKQRIPIIRRSVEAILGLLIGLGLCFLGWLNLYYKRRILGATLVGSGWLLGAGALGLLWLARFPSTWGWPL